MALLISDVKILKRQSPFQAVYGAVSFVKCQAGARTTLLSRSLVLTRLLA